jgi:TonB-linked SusC/RagA family outer membrane protein
MKRNSLFINHGIKRFLPKKIMMVARIALVLLFAGTLGSYAATPLSSTEQNNTKNARLQVTEVTGVVIDNEGEPLPGVSILIKGTTVGTITELNGHYSIEIPTGSGQPVVLVYSFIGFKVQEIAVGNQTTIDVTLEVETLGLDEVVVVGYGSQKKSDVTAAISSIKAEDIVLLPTARVDQAIQGRTSGVYVLNTDGSPGGKTMIRIRGLNSINGGNEPLIVIDGLQGGDLESLNPMDIQSMEILKDASATAIYGSRGANGVILITTKLGRPGKPVIDASASVGIQNLLRQLPTLSAGDYARHVNAQEMTNTGGGNIPTPKFTDAEIAEYDRNGGTNWQDEIYETGVMQNYNLAMSGAMENLRYMVSANYLDHQGILKNSQYNRLSLRTNINADIAKWVDFGLNYAFTKETYKSPPFRDEEENGWTGQAVNNAARWAPTEPVYDDQGNYWKHRVGYGPYDTWNPMASAVEPDITRPTYKNNLNLFLNFDILEGLSLKITGGTLITNINHRDYYNKKTKAGTMNNGFATLDEAVYETWQNSNILAYDNTWGGHHLTLTGVVEQIYNRGRSTHTSAKQFIVDQLGYNNIGGAGILQKSSSASERSLLSYMGRINYGFLDRYLLTFTYRADGSSVFGADNKWGYFPSGSVAWRISEEPFLQGAIALSDLKLRASYGQTGNQGISPYQSLARLYSSPGDWGPDYPWNGFSPTNTGFAIGGLANPNLKWETTAQTNIGLDLMLWSGRLSATIDMYKKKTTDLLMDRSLPGYIGVSSVLDNVGSVENRGLEVMIGGDPISTSNWRWNTSFNITANRNKVLDLGDDDELTYRPSYGGYSLERFMLLRVGEPYGTMEGWEYLGVWKTSQDAEARSYGQLPGDQRFRDVNNDGQIDDDDKVIIGNGYPDFTYGWSNRLTYRNWDLSLLFIGMQGVDLFNTLRIRRESAWEGISTVLKDVWTPQNEDTDVPGMIDGAYREEQALQNKIYMGGNSGATSRWVEDASFFRLKTITLSYNFSPDLIRSIGFDKIRLYFTGVNLFTITNYTGYDPEVAQFANWGDAMIGVDLSAYPPAKTYTFGVELTF